MKVFASEYCVHPSSLHRPIKLGSYWWVVFSLAYLLAADTPVVLMATRQPEDLVPVCAIQGNEDISPYSGQAVRTRGVVYADFEVLPAHGFYLQHEDCDGSLATSDGIFVYTGSGLDQVHSGDFLEVSGIVQEYHRQTEILPDADGLAILSVGQSLPPAAELDPPQDGVAAAAYLESLEGMHVRMSQANVVGPTSNDNQTWVINASLGVERVYYDDPQGVGSIIAVSDEGLFQISPQAKVTDRLLNLQGVLGGAGWSYQLHPLVQPELHPGDLPQEVGAPVTEHGFTVATFNLANLFDSIDDPTTEDSVLPAAQLQRRLQKRALAIHDILAEPDILVVQEAENLTVLQALLNQTEIKAAYGIVWEEGPDPRGLDIAVLYRLDRVILLGYEVRQGCTDLVDGLGPDGNGDVENPANAQTCDLSGDGILDGNRLFSRPPMVVRLRIGNAGLHRENRQQPVDLTLIANHWKSRIEDSPDQAVTLPRRIRQAQFVASLVQELRNQAGGSYLLVAGDLNDVPGSEPLAILKSTGLRDLTQDIEKDRRYTLIYQGVSQVVDYVLELPYTGLGAARVDAMHINADFPVVFAAIEGTVYRSSDHDPVWVNVIPFTDFVRFPQVYSR